MRATAAYSGILILIRQLISGLPMGTLEVVDQSHAETEQEFLAGGPNNEAWDADHFMELQMLPNFFAAYPQWQFIYDQMLNVGAHRWILSPSVWWTEFQLHKACYGDVCRTMLISEANSLDLVPSSIRRHNRHRKQQQQPDRHSQQNQRPKRQTILCLQ